MKPTKQILYAVWLDAYNAAKRRGFSQDDAANKAQETFDRLCAQLAGGTDRVGEMWMELP